MIIEIVGRSHRHTGGRGGLAHFIGFGDSRQQGQSVLALAARGENARQRDDRGFVAGIDTEHRLQTLLVPLRQQIGDDFVLSGRQQHVDVLLHDVLGLGALEHGHRSTIRHGEHRGNRLHPEGLSDTGVLVDVHLRQNDLAVRGRDDAFDDRTEGLARLAPRGPQIDDHRNGHGTRQNVVFERGIGDVDVHVWDVIGALDIETRSPRGTVCAVSDAPGIRIDAVTDWLQRNVAGAQGPFRFDVIAGGHSNLTYRVTAANGNRFVLRRPPLGHVLASAHDMGREHRIIHALQDTPVPVAPAVGFCDDPSINDAPFYVMKFVDGLVVRDREAAETLLTPDSRRRASESIVDTMAAIHRVDPTRVGLGDLGRHEGYIARQLKRWYGQWNQQKTRELPAVDRVHDALLARIPEQGPASLVHGDYRLDNCMIDANGNVIAVLDWEICTLGDPMADLGLLMVYWTGPGDDASAWTGSACSAPGFLDRADLAARYAEVSGRDTSQLDFYVTFAFWKLVCILEGVYARYLGGALGQRDPAELEPFNQQVLGAAARAEEMLGRLS